MAKVRLVPESVSSFFEAHDSLHFGHFGADFASLLDEFDGSPLTLHSAFVWSSFAVESGPGILRFLELIINRRAEIKSQTAVDLNLAVGLCERATLVELFQRLGALERFSGTDFHFFLSTAPAFLPVADEVGDSVNGAADRASLLAAVERLFRQLRESDSFADLIRRSFLLDTRLRHRLLRF